jgi:pyrimidine operon attenuation protein/uracil phosphoribosyltransferase
MSETNENTEKRMPKLREKGRLMSASEIERTLVRLAHEIVEKNDGGSNLGLVGIKRRGVPLAQRLGGMIEKIEKHPVDTGVLDISFYRDDLSTDGPRPTVTPGAIGFDVNGRDIVLMDDVLYTGRTIRAALDALFDHGRPKSVQLLVLIDRGHRCCWSSWWTEHGSKFEVRRWMFAECGRFVGGRCLGCAGTDDSAGGDAQG